LLDQLGVASQPSTMGFSVRLPNGLEYSGRGLDGLFAQRLNLLRPGIWRMILGIRRFYRDAREVLAGVGAELTLGQYLRTRRYSREFINWHLLPMAAAIWSAPMTTVDKMPIATLVRFFANHGFLELSGRPTWRVIQGGSRVYAAALTRRYQQQIQLATPVLSVQRNAAGVDVALGTGDHCHVDEVVLACHSDQALKLLADASPAERDILGAIAYQANTVTLHRDTSVMPRTRRAWASWNVHPESGDAQLRMSYCMNLLQTLDAPETYCVSLNHLDRIASTTVIRELLYHHPCFNHAAIAAQQRHREISGRRFRTHYVGAYWGYGFHEDGVTSARTVAREFGIEL
jgi:predicted NAD/FAD-binding protein